MTTPVATPVGDANFIAEYFINTRVYGVVIPPGAGATQEFWATYEIQSDQGTLMMAVVIGPQGAAGINAFAMLLQTDPYDDPSELPGTLTNSVADIGKYWAFDDTDSLGNIIGSSLWVWYGTSYRRLMLGSPGPPGPVPIITPSVTMIAATQNPSVSVGGTPLYPTWDLLLPKVPGPPGPPASLAMCPDVDFTTAAPVPGDLLGFTGRFTTDGNNYPIWVPVSVSQVVPSAYSMPESAFTSFSGLAQRAPIGSFSIPPQAFPWTPIVWGHIGAFGLELSANPLTIGAEVRLNDQSAGPLIGRGFGNTLGEVNIVPHYSDPNNPGVALTPTNSLALVQAGQSATIYVNLYNDGAIGVYQFNPTDAQLYVQVTPVADTTGGGGGGAPPPAPALSNGQQLVTVSNATGGFFTLSQGGSTTPPLPWNATPPQIQNALTNLPSIGSGNALGTLLSNVGSTLVEFVGGLAQQAIDPIITDATGLLPPGVASVFTDIIDTGGQLISHLGL